MNYPQVSIQILQIHPKGGQILSESILLLDNQRERVKLNYMAEPLEGGTPASSGTEGQPQGQDTKNATENPQKTWGFLEKPSTNADILFNLDNKQKEELVSGSFDYMRDVLGIKDVFATDPEGQKAIQAIAGFLNKIPFRPGETSIWDEVWRKMSPTRNPESPGQQSQPPANQGQ